MKIIHVTPTYYPRIGGVEVHVKCLCESLVKKNIDVEVFTTDFPRVKKPYETINGVKINRVFSFAPNNAYFFPPHLFGHLKKVKVDILHAHDIHSFPIIFAALAKKFYNAPLVSNFYFHGSAHTPFRSLLFEPYKSIFGNYVLKKTDLLICLSENEKLAIQRSFRRYMRSEVISAGLRFDPLSGSPRRNNLTKKITFVGRLEKYKGVQYLLQAFNKLLKETPSSLYIIGNGSYKLELQKMVKDMNISDKVIFSSKIGDEIIDEYYTSDVVVLPSLKESFNLVAVEALACGIPVITTIAGEGRTLAKNNFCILVHNPADIDELSEKIKKGLDLNYYEQVMSQRNKVIDRYSYDRIADLTILAYERVLARTVNT